MSRHTPGPWAFIVSDLKSTGFKRKHWQVGQEGQESLGVALAFGESEANARLIAAAPELLEALKALESAVVSYGIHRSKESPQWLEKTSQLFKAITHAREAIAKADPQ